MKIKKWICCLGISVIAGPALYGQDDTTVTDQDRKKDVMLVTSMGDMVIRLSDSTPLHRDNFLSLVKRGFYDSLLFHRVIGNFMIQSGDPDSRHAEPGQPLGFGGLDYTIPAEFRPTLFHKKGVIAAARDNNPQKSSSATQFYLVQGKIFKPEELDSIIRVRAPGRILTEQERKTYTTVGGAPHLDQNYTVFGEVVRGLEIIDRIAAVETSTGRDRDRPVDDVRILKARLVKRKKNNKG
jgi:peptidyl-prolyl cis-trans isomerase B (cyclophilin B)